MPFGIDALVIVLAATDDRLFWLYPLLATAGSLAGAAVTFWIGHRAGEAGLGRLVSRTRLQQVKSQVGRYGACAMAVPAVLPPPFPLTPFVLACGALRVNRRWFFSTFALLRLLRFSAWTILARVYGSDILGMLSSLAT